MSSRRKSDMTDYEKSKHEELWDKWQLESAIFYAANEVVESQCDETIMKAA